MNLPKLFNINKINFLVIYLILLFFSSTLTLADDLPKEKDTKPESKKVDYGSYMQDLQKQMQANWNPPKGKPQSKVTVRFKVRKNGELIKDTLIVQEGSSPEAEKAAREAVLITAPKFKPLPEGSADPVEIQFSFDQIGSGYLKKQEAEPESFDFHLCGIKDNNFINLDSWADKRIDCSIVLKTESLLKQIQSEEVNGGNYESYHRIIQISNEILSLNSTEIEAFGCRAIASSVLGDYKSAVLDYDHILNLKSYDKLTLMWAKKSEMKKAEYSPEKIKAFDKEIENYKRNSYKDGLDNSSSWQGKSAIREARLGNLESTRKYAVKAQELYKKQNHIGGQDYIERFLRALNEHETQLAQKKKQ